MSEKKHSGKYSRKSDQIPNPQKMTRFLKLAFFLTPKTYLSVTKERDQNGIHPCSFQDLNNELAEINLAKVASYA